MLSAVEIWLTSVIIFGFWLWEIDRGGPIARARGDLDDPDLPFPQMTDPSLTSTPWTPTFIDYLYVSLTNSTAFSLTDTPAASDEDETVDVRSVVGIVGLDRRAWCPGGQHHQLRIDGSTLGSLFHPLQHALLV